MDEIVRWIFFRAQHKLTLTTQNYEQKAIFYRWKKSAYRICYFIIYFFFCRWHGTINKWINWNWRLRSLVSLMCTLSLRSCSIISEAIAINAIAITRQLNGEKKHYFALCRSADWKRERKKCRFIDRFGWWMRYGKKKNVCKVNGCWVNHNHISLYIHIQ